jgi:hypothetical protein
LPDSFLIFAPLLVLAVVLLLGFAGCHFARGVAGHSLTFRATVPTDLMVVSPGVHFEATKPDGTVVPIEVAAATPSVEGYITAALDLRPALLWSLGDINGLLDRSATGHDGIAMGGVDIGLDPDGPTDFADARATLFDGTNDGIGSAYDPFVGTAPRTFTGWARWDAGGAAEYTLFGTSAGDADRPTLRVVVGNRNIVWLPSGGAGQVISWAGAAGPQDKWFMWALVADPENNTASLFIDGALVSARPMTDDWPPAAGTFQAAIGAATKQPFKGAQGLVAVYERALSDAEIAGLYEASQGEENVYEWTIPLYPAGPSSTTGTWSGRCAMTVRQDGQTASDDSPDRSFEVAADQSYALNFHTQGSPSAPPFEVVSDGISQE